VIYLQRPEPAASEPVRIYAHGLGVITSSCGTCADGNLPNTTLKYRTAGETCLISWQGGQSRCDRSSQSWTYWQDVWTWLGALNPRFYPIEAQPAIRRVARRFATGPWGAGVWWGNTLQYFVVVWIGTMLLWQEGCPQLDYYAYGAPDQPWPPLGGFCEQYQAQGYEEVVKNLPLIEAALQGQQRTVKDLYSALACCSRCEAPCEEVGVGPAPSQIYCTSNCTKDFLDCFLGALRNPSSCRPDVPDTLLEV
ncbi:unnamed protein product, partial [Durusdinium trenchii]